MRLSIASTEPLPCTLQQLPLDALADCCAAETQRFFRRQPCDPQFGYELFRRALVDKDNQAWAFVYAHYQPLVAGWLKQQLRGQVSAADVPALIDDTFVKLLGTFVRHPEKFNDYPHLNALLGLLRRCSQRIAQDYTEKIWQQPAHLPLDEDMIIIAATPTNSDALWSTLATLLQDEQEQLVVRYLWIEDYKPRHLYADYPHLFQGVAEINTIRERLKARLSRNWALRQSLYALSEN